MVNLIFALSDFPGIAPPLFTTEFLHYDSPALDIEHARRAAARRAMRLSQAESGRIQRLLAILRRGRMLLKYACH